MRHANPLEQVRGGNNFVLPDNNWGDAMAPIGNFKLRDLFAAFALSGLLPSARSDAAVAQEAYRIADAMLTERERKE